MLLSVSAGLCQCYLQLAHAGSTRYVQERKRLSRTTTKRNADRLQHLYDSGKVTQVEGVVGLGGCGEQLSHRLAVHVQGGCNDAWAQFPATVRKSASLQVPAQYGLENGHQCLVCHLNQEQVSITQVQVFVGLQRDGGHCQPTGCYLMHHAT
jgi:hypothetical protein